MSEDIHPYYVCWYMTERCNLSCPFCYAFKARKDVSFQRLCQVGRALSCQGVKKVNLMGGEPFLQKHIFPIIDSFGSCFDLSITTNGTMITENHLQRLRGKIERLTISLDTVDYRTGHVMRGRNYTLNETIRALKAASQFGIPLKVNTVITVHNIKELENVGHLLDSLKTPIFWKLFELTSNPNVTINIAKIKPSTESILARFDSLKRKFPLLPIDIATTNELNSKYVIVRSNGDVHIPEHKSYACLGNVCNESLLNILSRIRFKFSANRDIYALRNPKLRYLEVGNVA